MFSKLSSFMKRRFLSGMLLLVLAGTALAQPAPAWVNNTLVLGAPQIDALNVTNNNYVGVFLTNITINFQLFDTSDTLNFHNSVTGTMEGEPGFRFDTAPAFLGIRHRADNFVNEGVINAGSFTNRFGNAFT